LHYVLRTQDRLILDERVLNKKQRKQVLDSCRQEMAKEVEALQEEFQKLRNLSTLIEA